MPNKDLTRLLKKSQQLIDSTKTLMGSEGGEANTHNEKEWNDTEDSLYELQLVINDLKKTYCI